MSVLCDCPFRYQGQYLDTKTGLYYNRFRYYDPEVGNYISQDPIGLEGGNPTLYGYVKDVNTWIDELGLELKGWISKDLYTNLKNSDSGALDSFLRALEKGEVTRAQGASGIKQLKGGGFELKTAPHSKYGNHRLYGNMETIQYKNKKGVVIAEENVVVFRQWKKSH